MEHCNTIGHKLRMINKEIRNYMEEKKAANGDDLTPMQRWIVGFLKEHQQEDIYQRDIEEEFSVSRATASNMLQLMERKGLIERVPVAHDARLKKVVLTKRSMRMMEQVDRDVTEIEALLTKGMSPEEVEQFRGCLDHIILNLGGDVCMHTRCCGSGDRKAHVKK